MDQSRDQLLPLPFPHPHISGLGFIGVDPCKMGLCFPGAQEKAAAHNRISRLIRALLGAGNSPLEIRSRLSRLPNLQPLRSGFNSLHVSGPAVGKVGDPSTPTSWKTGNSWERGALVWWESAFPWIWDLLGDSQSRARAGGILP